MQAKFSRGHLDGIKMQDVSYAIMLHWLPQIYHILTVNLVVKNLDKVVFSFLNMFYY